jgi:hypothetical protein
VQAALLSIRWEHIPPGEMHPRHAQFESTCTWPAWSAYRGMGHFSMSADVPSFMACMWAELVAWLKFVLWGSSWLRQPLTSTWWNRTCVYVKQPGLLSTA